MFSYLDSLLLTAGVLHYKKKHRTIAFLFCLPFFLVGAFIFWSSNIVRPLEKAASQSWDAVPATVIESKLGRGSGDSSDSRKVLIEYSYSYGGNFYTGDRYSWDKSSRNFNLKPMRDAVEAHPKGKEITVYVDPDDPGSSIINRDSPATSAMELFFPIPFLLIGSLGMGFALFAGFFARRTRRLYYSIAEVAESRGLQNFAAALGRGESSLDQSDEKESFVFLPGSNRAKALGLLFASIFWNGIVSGFLALLISQYLESGELEILLALFLIPFVLVGLGLIFFTVRLFRAPVPPRYLFHFSPAYRSAGAQKIAASWLLVPEFGRTLIPPQPPANARLQLSRNLHQRKAGGDARLETNSQLAKKNYDQVSAPHEFRTSDLTGGESQLTLESVPTPKTKFFNWSAEQNVTIEAHLSYLPQKAQKEHTVTTTLILPKSND